MGLNRLCSELWRRSDSRQRLSLSRRCLAPISFLILVSIAYVGLSICDIQIAIREKEHFIARFKSSLHPYSLRCAYFIIIPCHIPPSFVFFDVNTESTRNELPE